MVFLIMWSITILIAFLITRFGFKLDVKYDDGYTLMDFDNWGIVVALLIVLIIPFVNVFLSIIFLLKVLYEINDDSQTVENFMKKFFFIKVDKN